MCKFKKNGPKIKLQVSVFNHVIIMYVMLMYVHILSETDKCVKFWTMGWVGWGGGSCANHEIRSIIFIEGKFTCSNTCAFPEVNVFQSRIATFCRLTEITRTLHQTKQWNSSEKFEDNSWETFLCGWVTRENSMVNCVFNQLSDNPCVKSTCCLHFSAIVSHTIFSWFFRIYVKYHRVIQQILLLWQYACFFFFHCA